MKWAKQKGFTIVELLIVIVVIGILAAITIVAFNGVQQRAQTATKVEALASYVKGLGLHAVQNGTYPGSQATVCLDGTSTCWAGANAAQSQNTKTALMPFMTTFPDFSNMAFAYGTQGSFTGWYIAFIVTASTCPGIGGTVLLNQTISGSTVTCRIGLASPS